MTDPSSAHTATATAGMPASASAPTDSSLGRATASQMPSAASAASTPPRDVVSASATSARKSIAVAPARTRGTCSRRAANHSQSGSETASSSASPFQYCTGS